MTDTVVWLWCMWRIRRKYYALKFEDRHKFMTWLRPYLSEHDNSLEYPHAFFYVKPVDVKRAIDNS